MPKAANKIRALNKTSKEIFVYVALLFILFLVSVNVNSFLKTKSVEVLGAETQNDEVVFWQDFLNKNPDYIPGWIEIGRADRANEIDPNYIIKP